MAAERVYLVPGMFGFGELGGYEYFQHVRRALASRYQAAGRELITVVVPTPPTASLRQRARVLAETVADTAGDGRDPIHLIGHSTGGLDVRLALSPTSNPHGDNARSRWRDRVRTAVSINAPHYGTPLAGYFATVSGTRVLHALSLLTVVSLTVGEPSLAVFSRALASLGTVEQFLGGGLPLVGRATDLVLRFVAEERRGEIAHFLDAIRVDQGAIVQIMPEAMDLFNATAEDDGRVRYGSVATAAPAPAPWRLARAVRSPYAALTAAMYSSLYELTARRPREYPYARPTKEQESDMRRGIRNEVTDRSNDGVVPTLSQVWGDLVWSGEGDHLDVLGHFRDDAKGGQHVDWMTSGAGFDRARFSSLVDAIAAYEIGSGGDFHT